MPFLIDCTFQGLKQITIEIWGGGLLKIQFHIHNNKLYPQVGSITMDQMMVDITDSNEIKIGSTMVLLGSDGDKTISPLEWARKSNTIPWEILCSFKNRLPKVQVD